jgi:serine/threonine protein kinase
MSATPSVIIGPFHIPVHGDGSWIAFGQGSSGIVTRAQDTRTGGIIALKIIPVSLPEDKKTFVVGQLQELYASKHPSVVEYYGADYFEEKSCIMIALEFMDLASFKDLRNQYGPIPEAVLGYACGKILEGLLYLHRERRLIHRDIKPSNLLLSSTGQVLRPSGVMLMYFFETFLKIFA